jgi:hypothetical protein
LLDGLLLCCITEGFTLSLSTLRQNVLPLQWVLVLQYVRQEMCALRFAKVCGRGEVELAERLDVHINQSALSGVFGEVRAAAAVDP